MGPGQFSGVLSQFLCAHLLLQGLQLSIRCWQQQSVGISWATTGNSRDKWSSSFVLNRELCGHCHENTEVAPFKLDPFLGAEPS